MRQWREALGRVFGALTIINGLAMPLGIVFFGPLGDAVKIEFLLIATGALLVLGSFLMYQRKELIQVGEA